MTWKLSGVREHYWPWKRSCWLSSPLLFWLILLTVFLCLLKFTVPVFLVFAINRYRNGRIVIRLRRRWRIVRSQPQFLIRRRWLGAKRYKGRITVVIRGRPIRIKFLRGRVYRRKGRRWRRIVYKRRKGQRRRRRRRRNIRRYRRKLRRIRRRRRRRRRRLRRIRRYRRFTSPLKIYYRGKTRLVYRWKGILTIRLGGQRRRIR